MLYFVGGANNDQDGWNYIKRFQRVFTTRGIQNFTRVNASHGKIRDILFTVYHNREAWYPFLSYGMGTPEGPYTRPISPPERAVGWRRIEDQLVHQVSRRIRHDIQSGSTNGQQLNLFGYSYGGVFQAHVALLLMDRGVQIDYLILIGTPIPPLSRLYQYLNKHEAIKKLIRYDISDDLLSSPSIRSQMMLGAIQNLFNRGHHFDVVKSNSTSDNFRPGIADKHINKLADHLFSLGVR